MAEDDGEPCVPFDNVVLFPGTYAPDLPVACQPNAPTIALLEDLLRDARMGLIQGIGVAIIDYNAQTTHDWAGAERHSCALLIGALQCLSQEIATRSLSPSASAGEPPEPS